MAPTIYVETLEDPILEKLNAIPHALEHVSVVNVGNLPASMLAVVQAPFPSVCAFDGVGARWHSGDEAANAWLEEFKISMTNAPSLLDLTPGRPPQP